MAQLSIIPAKIIKRKCDDLLTPKEYKEKYSGIKKAPQVNIDYAKSLIVSKQKAKRRIEAKKVRPHESMNVWEGRMRKDSLMSEKQIERILEVRKYKIRIKNQKRDKDLRERDHANKTLTLFYNKKFFDYLSYLGMVKNFFCVKHGIRKDDFDIALAFYNNVPITVERFNNVCILNVGKSAGILKRFKDNNYIIELEMEREYQIKNSSQHKTGVYKINKYLSIIISDFYKIMIKFEIIKKATYKGVYPPEVEKEFISINQEIQDYLDGNKKQELIK